MARPRKRSATELSKFLDAALAQNGLTHNAFCHQIGMNPSTFSSLKLRIETPAPDRETVHQWAMALGIGKSDEDQLFDLVQLAYAPRYVQELVAKLRVSAKTS